MPDQPDVSLNIANTKKIYDAVLAGDVETAFGLFDEQIVIQYYGVPDIPYSGTFEGLAGAADFFTRVGGAIRIVEMEPYTFIPDGDNLAVWGHQKFVRLDNDAPFESDFAHIISLRDGNWRHFRDFMNSAVTADVFRMVPTG